MSLTAKSLILVAVLGLVAACSSANIKAPTGVDRGVYNGAGAGGGNL